MQNCLKKWNQTSKYDVISFDIFNTILMRTVDDPTDIFELVGEKLIIDKLMPLEINAERFKLIRQAIEKRAYEERKMSECPEITLYDIYNQFPKSLGLNASEMVSLELEIESQHVYLNPIINSLIKELNSQNKRIILVSDMYLGEDHIRKLLECVGFDLSLVSDIFVSSECGVNKRDGRLYQYVLDRLGMTSEELIHIGDDLVADVKGAGLAGVNSIQYRIFEDEPVSISIERQCFKDRERQLSSVRLIANEIIKDSDNNSFWFNQGALIWGPILTTYAEWLMKFVRKNEIKNIYPFMREAVLIEKVLQMACKQHGVDCNIQNMYVSRETTALACYEEFDEQLFEYLLEQRAMDVNSLFHMLKIEDDCQDYYGNRYAKLLDIRQEGKASELYTYLCSTSRKQKIDAVIKEKQNILFEYIDNNFDVENDFLTVDIGFTGTIPYAIDYVLSKKGIDNHHTTSMLIGNKNSVNTIIKGTKILSYIQENQAYNQGVARYYKYMEGLFMDEKGSTIGYTKDNGQISPVLQENIIDQVQLSHQRDFQDGVLFFQDLFYKCKIDIKCQTSIEALMMMKRLYECPLKEEADNYLHYKFEQNIGKNVLEQTDVQKELRLLEEKGIDAFVTEQKQNDIYWAQGIIALKEAEYNFKNAKIKSDTYDTHSAAMMNICNQLKNDNVKDVIVYGAGDVGKVMAKMAQIYQINILCFVDKNENLWSRELSNGKYIYSLDDAIEKYNCDCFVVASLAWIEDIKNTIKQKDINCKIYNV